MGGVVVRKKLLKNVVDKYICKTLSLQITQTMKSKNFTLPKNSFEGVIYFEAKHYMKIFSEDEKSSLFLNSRNTCYAITFTP